VTACIYEDEKVVERERLCIFHMCALITEAEARRDLAADGTLGTRLVHNRRKIGLIR
jgi:hypothetical protein